ncbi:MULTISPECIES: hypothetical protein [unclassified Lysinibacillus]|uniref:hypothetical protein n=1 Tax=unclassified Lysinibacillus TaxID=2636778 RepID=UPI0030F685F8
MAYEGNQLALGNVNTELQQMIEQGGLYKNIDPLEATNGPNDYPTGESFFADTNLNIESWRTATGVDATFTRLFVITRVDKHRLHTFQDIILASPTMIKHFVRYNLNAIWLTPYEVGGDDAPEYGVERINDNHAIRRFPVYTEWAGNVNQEALQYKFPDVPLVGLIKIRGSIPYESGIAAGGGVEAVYNVNRGTAGSTAIGSDLNITHLSSNFANRFFMGTSIGVVGDFRPYISILKKATANPLYMEFELITSNGNAGDILEGITYNLITSYDSPNTTPPQQSIFTHVGNSKQNLATAITGKGVTTSADATFAQMVANINAIPTGKKYVYTSLNFGYVQGSFEYAASTSTTTMYYAYLDLPADFDVDLIEMRSTSGDSYEILISTAIDFYYNNGTMKVMRFNGNANSSTTYNFKIKKDTAFPNRFVVASLVGAMTYVVRAYAK